VALGRARTLFRSRNTLVQIICLPFPKINKASRRIHFDRRLLSLNTEH
jgi:hypothetical protein